MDLQCSFPYKHRIGLTQHAARVAGTLASQDRHGLCHTTPLTALHLMPKCAAVVPTRSYQACQEVWACSACSDWCTCDDIAANKQLACHGISLLQCMQCMQCLWCQRSCRITPCKLMPPACMRRRDGRGVSGRCRRRHGSGCHRGGPQSKGYHLPATGGAHYRAACSNASPR